MSTERGESVSPDEADLHSSSLGELSPSEIIDLERAQIGHDLHDLLLPLIFAASANLQPLIDGRVPVAEASEPESKILERLRQSQDWLQQAQALGRNLLTEIYPAELDRLVFLVAARDTAERLCSDQCEVTWDVAAESPLCQSDLSRDLAATAYRILVESLRNAIRHGKAKSILIACSADCLTVCDNGGGFDPGTVPGNRFGIRSMKGRAKLVGQSLSVESKLGGPTTVCLSLPSGGV